MLVLVLAHFAAALVAPVVVNRMGRYGFLLLAGVPAAACVWALTWSSRITDGQSAGSVVSWIPDLGLNLALAMGSLQWILVLLVTGVGTLVMVYCAWYFTDDELGLPAFAGHLVAFAGAMLGLVLADDLLLLYVFWELTTVFSYLLIGHDPVRRASRAAALQALLITTLGGLAMLVGMLLLGVQAGTFRISELLAEPPSGAAVTVAIALILLGAISKSALFPFHFWLPGAMAAPTPVSAYLHAAAMVKAGVYLVGLLAPTFSNTPGWHGALLTLGLLTMLIGGLRALRQFDIKLLLAYGTVSQLGFLAVVLSVGTREAALAGAAMLTAHALFKATLFMVVGIIDRQTGTRDLRELCGVGRSAPLLASAALVAGASMAGLPPLAGFVAKESVYGALLEVVSHSEQAGISRLGGWVVLVGVVLGSTLTVAYTARFLWGALAGKPAVDPCRVGRIPAGFLAAPLLLAALTIALGFLGGPQSAALRPYAETAPAGHLEELALWHGLGPALGLSAVSLGLGLILYWRRRAMTAFQVRFTSPWSAERGYFAVMRSLDRGAVEITALTQRGSVTTYLGVIFIVLVAAAATGLSGMLDDFDSRIDTVLWDRPGQGVVAVVIAVAAVLATRARRRLKAVLLVGVTGYGTAMLFLLHGAPDLALTQALVETVTLVAFVLVLRRMPEYFTDRAGKRRRLWRAALGGAVAAAVAGLMLISTGARTRPPVSATYPEEAVEFGGGHNIVNVTLVDIRAWDTMGEISVLVAAATGVASLVFLGTRNSKINRVPDAEAKVEEPIAEPGPVAPRRPVWLTGGRMMAPDRRSVIFEVVTRLIFHAVIVFSVYLLLAGHNDPGGGFAAGLVAGLALVVRYLAGGRYELDEAAPVDAGALMGIGLFIAGASALTPLAFGGVVFQSATVDIAVPLLGELHVVTSFFFDLGVYLLVIGLVLDLLRSLGSELDREIRRASENDHSSDQSSGQAAGRAAGQVTS